MKKKSTNKITDVQKYLEEINYIENGPKYEPPEWSKFEPDSGNNPTEDDDKK